MGEPAIGARWATEPTAQTSRTPPQGSSPVLWSERGRWRASRSSAGGDRAGEGEAEEGRRWGVRSREGAALSLGPLHFSPLQSRPSSGPSSSCPCRSFPPVSGLSLRSAKGCVPVLLSGLDIVQRREARRWASHSTSQAPRQEPAHSHRPEGSPRPGPPRWMSWCQRGGARRRGLESNRLGFGFFPSSFSGCQLVWADNLNSVSSSMKRGKKSIYPAGLW